MIAFACNRNIFLAFLDHRQDRARTTSDHNTRSVFVLDFEVPAVAYGTAVVGWALCLS